MGGMKALIEQETSTRCLDLHRTTRFSKVESLGPRKDGGLSVRCEVCLQGTFGFADRYAVGLGSLLVTAGVFASL